MPRILVAVPEGLVPFDDDGAPGEVELERPVTTMGPSGPDVLAVTNDSEIWRWRSEAWQQIAELNRYRVRCIASMNGDVFVGTSEAHLFRIAGQQVQPVPGFEQAPGRSAWHTPWGGPPDTRSMANWDGDLYVNVHVGGVLRSDDRGETWTPTIDINADVHHVTTADGLVLAACAYGLAVSGNRGGVWTMRADGLDALYARAVAVCGTAVLVSTSDGPRGGRAAVYRGDLADGPLERCRAGPGWFDGNIDTYCLDALPDGSFSAFATADGHLYASTDMGTNWNEVASGLSTVRRVLVLP